MLLRLFGKFSTFSEEIIMSKEAQKSVQFTDEAKKKLEECVSAFAACGFGEGGPPKETTFAQIEEFGHEVGRMVARAVDEKLTTQHATHFREPTSCPCCGTSCSAKETPDERELQTTDGNVLLHEPVCRCSVCHRDFFPSASRTQD